MTLQMSKGLLSAGTLMGLGCSIFMVVTEKDAHLFSLYLYYNIFNEITPMHVIIYFYASNEYCNY